MWRLCPLVAFIAKWRVKEHAIHIVKYFENNHFSATKYEQEGGQKLVLPQNVR